MFRQSYDEMVRFASEGDLAEELQIAKQEFVERTGELFESDSSFERRIASFLEWYVLDRPVRFAPHKTPAKLYIDSIAAQLTTPELTELRGMAKTVLSVYEFKRAKADHLVVVDLVDGRKLEAFERRKPVGLLPGDLLEARLVREGDRPRFTDVFTMHPREARKVILQAIKALRKKGEVSPQARVHLVHRVAYFSNRCERYSHVDTKRIFAPLLCDA